MEGTRVARRGVVWLHGYVDTAGNAKTFLAGAIRQAQAKLDAVVASADGSGVAEGRDWVVPEIYEEVENAIARAQSVLDDANAGDEAMDFQVYELYFVLNGSGQDIGARFAGFSYDGLDNRLNGATVEADNGGFGGGGMGGNGGGGNFRG